jgi:iron-sulfur cluster assembly protein
MALTVVTLTDAAAMHIRNVIASHMAFSVTHAAGLRLSLKKGGCAGMEYQIDIVEAPHAGDDKAEKDGAKLYIDPAASLYLLGTEIDYEITKLRSGFVFRNPNQVSACGCGESVELKPAIA